MHPLLARLLVDGPVLTDGAWGTQLALRGLPAGMCPDGWNLSHPEVVEQVAQAYVNAGSQVILTNTFRANSLALANTPLADQVEAINRAGVEISRRAAAGRAAVFASIGPSGKMLLTGEVTIEQLMESFGQQARALAEAGADALTIETMTDLNEAKAALSAARETGLPIVSCMVFDSGKQHDRTMMGNKPEDVAQALTEAGADVIGANCGQGIEQYIPICRRLKAATDRPIWMKPNAGLPAIVDGQIHYHVTPDEFAERAVELASAGASFIGGCCGTSPDFIVAMQQRLFQGA